MTVETARHAIFITFDNKACRFTAKRLFATPDFAPTGLGHNIALRGDGFGVEKIIPIIEVLVDDLRAILGRHARPAATFKPVIG